ncbi:MAG: hypothetical protein WCP22_13175 [Chlamydiota bacterium]
MLRLVMWSSLFSDVGDPEWRDKMSRLHDVGIDGASGVCHLARTQFCEYPFTVVAGPQGASTSRYNLLPPYNQRWYDHNHAVAEYASQIGFGLQYDLWSHVGIRNDPLCFANNVQGVRIDYGTFQSSPSGIFAEIVYQFNKSMVPIINIPKLSAVLNALEGSGTEAFESVSEKFCRDSGLSSGVATITNDGLHGVLRSKHISKASQATGDGSTHQYISTDGFNGETTKDTETMVRSRIQHWDVAFESYLNGTLSSGNGNVARDKRTRPSATYIAQKSGAMIIALGKTR